MGAPIGNRNALGNKGGRPRKEIDFKVVEKLCALQCTAAEIAEYLGINANTLALRINEKFSLSFQEYFKQKRSMANISLRRSQWQSAEAGNVTMLIWLGKQYLNQSDKHEVRNELTGKDGGPVVLENVGLELLRRLDAKKENVSAPKLLDVAEPDKKK